MAIFKNTTVSGTGYITPPVGNTSQRTTIVTTTIQWTNTGSQSYSVLTGTTPTLSNTSWTAPVGVTQVEVLVVAGGGGGGAPAGGGPYTGGGGGAGGLIYNSAFAVTPGNSYTVTVGTGGSGASSSGAAGSVGNNSVFGSLTAIGGGGGGGLASTSGSVGGSGGGGSSPTIPYTTGSAGTAGQGFSGGRGFQGANSGGGGGGGAGGSGSDGLNGIAGAGGPGLNFNISGASNWYAGGGGGSTEQTSVYAIGGIGGGGQAGNGNGSAGTASTGGGGGGGSRGVYSGGAGGSGIVIIRYTVASDTTNPTANIRYNADVRKLEVYESAIKEWVPQDSSSNFSGHNLLTYSEQFDNSAWAKTNITVTANSVIAPDGTLTADTITTSSTATSYIRYDTAAQGTSVFITVSAYVKSASSSTVTISDGYGTGANATFNLSTGAIVQSSDGGYGYSNPGIINAGNGWWRIWQTFKTQPSNNYPIGHRLEPGRTYGGTGSVGDSVYAWGAQVEKAYTPGPYTRTIDTTSPIPTELGGYRLHTYTTVGTSGFTPACTGFVEVLVVAGGGSGPSNNGGGAGGGGGGGVIYSNSYQVIANTRYTVTVGAGGAIISGAFVGNNGSNSQFGSLVAVGGGGGGNNTQPGRSGGSGGGSGEYAITNSIGYGGGYVPNQGFPGGYTTFTGGCGGGGGAGGPGGNCTGTGSGGVGGPGVVYSISGKETYYGGGGGSSVNNGPGGAGGIGGGGNGGAGSGGSGTVTSGTPNTGGGGGGTYQSGAGTASGGSGIVIVRYRYD
jgi:hypothetical protein